MPETNAVRLTPPQAELLDDIATNPEMFINQYSRWNKTTRVLIRLGLAARTPGSSYNGQYEITITPAGRSEWNRRTQAAEVRSGAFDGPS